MPSESQIRYDDSYSTCIETYSTLRVFSFDLAPDEISSLLKIDATTAFRKGDCYSQGRLHRKSNGWFYCTKQFCKSRDTRRHLDIILNALADKFDPLKTLQEAGSKIDITCFWLSTGQGGPWLMPEQMAKLGVLGIGIWWDIFFHAKQPRSSSSGVLHSSDSK